MVKPIFLVYNKTSVQLYSNFIITSSETSCFNQMFIFSTFFLHFCLCILSYPHFVQNLWITCVVIVDFLCLQCIFCWFYQHFCCVFFFSTFPYFSVFDCVFFVDFVWFYIFLHFSPFSFFCIFVDIFLFCTFIQIEILLILGYYIR